MRNYCLIVVVCVVLGLLALAPTVGRTQDEVRIDPPEVQRIADLVAACADLAPNTLCYGGGEVELRLTGGQALRFENPGEHHALHDVARVQTAIRADDCTWGGVVMNVQGSQPLGQPGMTFIALGNVTVENTTGTETLFELAQPITIDLPSRVNIRAQPNLDAEVLTSTQSTLSLPADALSADGAWVRVRMDDATAWVFRELVTSTSDLRTLPTVNEDAHGWAQAFTVHTEASPCESQLPSLLLIQTPEGVLTPLTINGSKFIVGSTIVLTHRAAVNVFAVNAFAEGDLIAGEGSPPKPDLTAGEGVPPDPDDESLLVIEGSVGVFLADGSVMPIAPGCALHTRMADGSVLPQEDRTGLGESSLDCGILNNSTMEDISAPIHITPEQLAYWADYYDPVAPDYCVAFEGVSPLSGSILFAPSPPENSQLTFTFPLLPYYVYTFFAGLPGEIFTLWDYEFYYQTEFHLENASGTAVPSSDETVFDLQVPMTSSDNIVSLNYTYEDLIQHHLITPGQTSGTLHWWVEVTAHFVQQTDNLQGYEHVDFTCETDVYTLDWSDNPSVNYLADTPSGQTPAIVSIMGSFSLLPLLNDLLAVDISDPGISAVPEYVVDWTESNNQEDGAFCAGFEGISPQSGSLLLAPSPQNASQLTLTQLTFNFPLVPSDLSDLDFADLAASIGFDTTFYLATGNTIKTSYGFDQHQIAGHVETEGNVIESITFSYADLIESNLIAEGQTAGTLVWWAEFNFSNDEFNLDNICVTDLYTLHWSNTPGDRTSQTVSTAIHNFPTPANTIAPTTTPDLSILGGSATPPFTFATPTVIPATNVPPTNVPPTAVRPTDISPTNVPPTFVRPTDMPPPTANPDRDGDGVANDQDGCPDQAGPRENRGCPLPPPPPDGDGDGVPDEVDVCPGIPGPRDNRGCPTRG